MSELPRNIGEFVARDLVFTTGGALVLTSFLHLIDRLPCQHTPTAYWLLALGVSYALGYTLQELFSILRLVTTRNVYRPNRFLLIVFRHYDPDGAFDVSGADPAAVRRGLLGGIRDERWSLNHQRIITHMMVGSTLAPCLLAASFLLFRSATLWNDPDDAMAGYCALGLGLVLWALNWMKAIQMTIREVELATPGIIIRQDRRRKPAAWENCALVSGVAFSFIALVHLWRVLVCWPLVMGPWPVPCWVSAIAVVLSSSLAAWALGYTRGKNRAAPGAGST